MTRSEVALTALVVVVACVAATAVHAAPHQRLTLPAFPLPPKRDLALLGMRLPQGDAAVVVDADAEEMSDAQVTELPRFRSGVFAAADAEADADSDTAEEQEQAVAEEESDEIVAATVQAADADADADAAVEAEEGDAEEAEAEAEEDAEEQEPRFVQPQQQPQMRFARALQRRYDANALPPGPLPVPASTLQYDLAHAPVQGFPDALPMPLHHSERQFLNAQPVESFAANPNAYAWAGARVQPNYVYGNTLIGAPVNAQFYPQPQPQPMAAPMPPAAPVAPATSFLQTAAAMAAAAPQWPSSIPRPAAFYLPPDLAI